MLNYLKRYDYKKLPVSLILAIITLGIIGCFCIFKADGMGIAKRQIIGLIFGLIVLAVVSLIDYHTICRFYIPLYGLGVLLLFLTRFSPLGTDHGKNAYRWLDIGATEIQPSELVKVIMIIVMAVILSKVYKKLNQWSVFIMCVFVMAVPTFLILIQTDLSSSAVCMFTFVVMIFMAGLSWKIIGILVPVGVPLSILAFWYVQQPYQKLLTGYQQKRILSFLHPEESASDGNYQTLHSVQAIASGGITGKTLMGDASDSRLYHMVFANESDFIFSVIGEELGFFGCLILIAIFVYVVIKCIVIGRRAKDITGRLIAYGVSGMLMFQSFVNIGVATSLLPNTGLPFPFLSYGLSSLLSSIIAVALVINVSLQAGGRKGLNFTQNDFDFE